ncbi:hypothetical protein GDO81_023639 [Engystomops pustulosus]|uniref:Uncharacterized protein n=1 Tax=Engystomops pustulosus TaxID=76066 RepID=A0AAV6ZHS1_ENGPU|nr:hypothetical protein GDO81_023639 [Engystomops pustulosus]
MVKIPSSTPSYCAACDAWHRVLKSYLPWRGCPYDESGTRRHKTWLWAPGVMGCTRSQLWSDRWRKCFLVHINHGEEDEERIILWCGPEASDRPIIRL